MLVKWKFIHRCKFQSRLVKEAREFGSPGNSFPCIKVSSRWAKSVTLILKNVSWEGSCWNFLEFPQNNALEFIVVFGKRNLVATSSWSALRKAHCDRRPTPQSQEPGRVGCHVLQRFVFVVWSDRDLPCEQLRTLWTNNVDLAETPVQRPTSYDNGGKPNCLYAGTPEHELLAITSISR